MGLRTGLAALALTGFAGAAAAEGFMGLFLGPDAYDVDAVAALPANPDAFLAEAQAGFLELAREELDVHDWGDGALFLTKARAAAAGEPFALETLEARGFDPEVDIELALARGEVAGLAVSPPALLRAPLETAQAVVAFECWIEQAEEGHQPDDIEACRAATEAAIAAVREKADLPDDLVVILPEDGVIGGVAVQSGGGEVLLDSAYAAAGARGGDMERLEVLEEEIAAAFGDALGARPRTPKEFTLTFAFGSRRVDDEARDKIALAVEEAVKSEAPEILVTGYADAPGSPAANLALSRQRARRVVQAIRGFDLPEKARIAIRARGERDLAEQTQAPEEDNRRVVILVR